MFVGPFEVLHGYPPRSSLSRDHSCARTSLLFEARAPRDSTEDRRLGLNMNYSIIFTEISFSPETSILLQIIQIIHMTIGDYSRIRQKREGSLSVLAPRQQTQCDSHR